MDHIDYKEKYDRLEAEYTSLKLDKEFQGRDHLASNHPFISDDWLDYARDNGFSFHGLKFPRMENDARWYDYALTHPQNLIESLSIHKTFNMCPTCGTRWTLLIQLNGDFGVWDDYGNILFGTEYEHSYYMEYFKLPKYISTVMDLMKVLDVIEMHKHGKGDISDP